jgi:hypothetical protein
MFSPVMVKVYWLINVAALCGLTGWIFSDGRFAGAAFSGTPGARSVPEFLASIPRQDRTTAVTPALATFIGVAALSAMGVAVGLFLGPAEHRRVRSWFVVTVILGLWLTLWLRWPDLAWRGQAFRLGGQIGEFQTLASSLNNDWPTTDGERPELGPFSAYPIDKPQVLVLLTQGEIPGASARFSAVERSDGGTLRFRLTGDELGAWLEWHPTHDEPAGFVGGLSAHREVARFESLGNDWYLVHYE